LGIIYEKWAEKKGENKEDRKKEKLKLNAKKYK
jgi:hypothetical protein